MKCEVIRNGQLVLGTQEFNPEVISKFVAKQGADYRLVPNTMTAAIKIGGIEIKPVREVKPSLDRMSVHSAPVRSETDYEVVYTYGTQAKSEQAIKDSLTLDLSNLHNQYDLDSTVFNGVRIKTDLEARVNVSGTLEAFKSGAIHSTIWRGIDGKITVNSQADMQVIYDAIFGHISAGFAAKEAVETIIGTATLTDLESLNVETEFHTRLSA